MPRPIEQRTGGPNGLEGLEKQGLVVQGNYSRGVSEVYISNGGETSLRVPVKPLVVFPREGGVQTVFKPTREGFKRLSQGSQK